MLANDEKLHNLSETRMMIVHWFISLERFLWSTKKFRVYECLIPKLLLLLCERISMYMFYCMHGNSNDTTNSEATMVSDQKPMLDN